MVLLSLCHWSIRMPGPWCSVTLPQMLLLAPILSFLSFSLGYAHLSLYLRAEQYHLLYLGRCSYLVHTTSYTLPTPLLFSISLSRTVNGYFSFSSTTMSFTDAGRPNVAKSDQHGLCLKAEVSLSHFYLENL